MVVKAKKPQGRSSSSRRSARSVFREIGVALTSRLELTELLNTILEQVRALLNPADSALYIIEQGDDNLIVYPEGHGRKAIKASKAGGIAGSVVHTGLSILADDGPAHPHYSEDIDLKAKRGRRAILCVPISSGDNVLGAIEILGKKFTPSNRELLQTIADFAAVAIENSRYVAKIEELTITDDLTGLYNGRQLGRVLDMEIRRSERYEDEFSIVFIDLDRFKEVNDTFGHLVGSRTLQETGRLIGRVLRDDIDAAFRYGGDEFVIILPRTSPEGARVVAKRIQSLLGRRLFKADDDRRFSLTASFGIASFPRDATTKEQIIKMADEAMYEVKKQGRNGIMIKQGNQDPRRGKN